MPQQLMVINKTCLIRSINTTIHWSTRNESSTRNFATGNRAFGGSSIFSEAKRNNLVKSNLTNKCVCLKKF